MSDDADQADIDVPANDADGAADAAQARTFTEEQVNRIVQERLARQKAQFKDYDELKDRAARLQELEDAQKSELEKAQERAVQLEKQAADAAARAQDAVLRSAVVAEAARKNVVDPDAAVALLNKESLVLGDDGAPTNIAEAMDELLKAKPYLVGGGRGSGSADLGARGGGVQGQITREQLKTMSHDEIVKAQKDGLLSHLLAGDS